MNLSQKAEKQTLEFPYRMKLVVELYGGVAKLSEDSGISASNLYELQTKPKNNKAIRLPNGYSAVCLALLTGVDLNWLFTGNGQSPAAKAPHAGEKR